MDYNDFELVHLAQSGDEDATNMLYQKYKPLIVKKSQDYFLTAPHHGIDINDVMQEAFIGFDEAIRNFSQDKEANFYTFAMICVDRQVINYLRKIKKGNAQTLNEAVTIDENMERYISDGTNIEDMLIGHDSDISLAIAVREELTEFEKRVLDLKLKDYTFEEIAKELNKDVKSIYNTLQRIRIKFKKKMENDD